jgi:hypothetical protein
MGSSGSRLRRAAADSSSSRTRWRVLAGLTGAVAVVAVPAVLLAWGEAGHRITGEAAALSIPREMPAFFRGAVKELSYINPEPDRWRDRAEKMADPALDGVNAPDHFIDMELVPPAVLDAALAAPDRYAYFDTVKKAGVEANKMGFLPFRILELSQRLREDFRQWRAAPDSQTRAWVEARVIDDAGLLGHYVADGSNPAHTTVQFNGWTGPNPNGYATDHRFHSRFESEYVESHITTADVTPQISPTPRVFPDLRRAIDEYLAASNRLVEPMYKLDKAHPFNAAATDPADKAFVVSRLAAGAQMLRDIWWTAWVTSAPAPRSR